MNYTLGIDPGVNGALALLDDAGECRGVLDMPTLAAGGKKGRRILDGPALIRWLRKLPPGRVTAMLEEVSSMPRDGHVAAFSFGRTYGTTETALAAAGIPYRTVRPAIWKKVMGVLADKDHARMKATQLIPSGAKHWPLKKHDGRAEAALIAQYGRQLVGG
jgi:crossover junction endodeoxyribonuclease RuvC